MKEIKKMNKNELMAYRLAKKETGYFIGGYENQMEDSEIGSEAYNEAKEVLNQSHERLVETCYYFTMQETEKAYLKNLRFAGEEFIKDCINTILTKWGY